MSADTYALDEVEAGLGDYLTAVEGGRAIRVSLSWATMYVRPNPWGEGLEILAVGRGGGLFAHRVESRQRLEARLRGVESLRLTRPGSPGELWPDRFDGGEWRP